MKNWITFGDFTTNQKGFLIEQLDEVPMPEKKLNFIEVEGYSGYLTQIGVVYSGQSFSYKYNKEKEKVLYAYHSSNIDDVLTQIPLDKSVNEVILTNKFLSNRITIKKYNF